MLQLEKTKLLALHSLAVSIPVKYEYGVKPALSPTEDWVSGNTSDCSGYSRWIVYHLTNHVITLPEGSVEQRELFDAHDVNQQSAAVGHCQDNILRFAFLAPVGGEPGHVMLLLNNVTYECHGGVGVGSREWGSIEFMSRCVLYEYAEMV